MKLEDTFAEHPKVELAGDDAAWLYVCGLLYSYRADTDGFVPANKVPKLTGKRHPMKLAERLVESGLWEAVEDGYVVHDYLKHQQSSAKREELRARGAERGKKHRANARTNADITALRNGSEAVRNSKVQKEEGDREVEELPNDNDSPPQQSSNRSYVPHPLRVSTFVDVDHATKRGEAA